jgi:hypothetical protein
MTIKEMHSWFDILQMKGVNTEFTVSEKNHIINRAQIKYVNEVLQKIYLPSLKANEKSEMVFSPTESVIAGHDAIHPLLFTVTGSSIGGSGLITYASLVGSIGSRLRALLIKPSGWTSPPLMIILGVVINFENLGKRINCRYLNTNDRHRNQTNIYRQATISQPTYSLEENRINIEPNDVAGKDYIVYGIREPEPVFYNNDRTSSSIDCELPNFTHDEILSIALDDAGVVKRDQALMTLNKANKENLSASF